jgi:hypothetical protein
MWVWIWSACDRIYLNGWVPNPQVSGQVVGFLTTYLGFSIPSPAILEKIGLCFRGAVDEFAAAHDIPVIRFAKRERKCHVMRPPPDRLAREGGCGVAAIGWPGVSAAVHRHHLPFRARWWRGGAVRLSQGRPTGPYARPSA